MQVTQLQLLLHNTHRVIRGNLLSLSDFIGDAHPKPVERWMVVNAGMTARMGTMYPLTACLYDDLGPDEVVHEILRWSWALLLWLHLLRLNTNF